MGKIITVQVKLLGSETSRPVQALSLREGLYKILPPADHNSEAEKWEYPPGSVIRISEKTDNDKKYFIARDKNKT